MKEKYEYNGVIVPMTTPFTPEGQIDEEAAERMASRLADHNIGIFVLGTTGETASIPRRERIKLVEAAMRVARDRVPIYAGIGDNCLSNSILAAQQYQKLGVTALVAHLPSYYPLDAEEMQNYFELLHSYVDAPLMIYNIPATTRMSIPIPVVENLSHLPHFVGFKDSENVKGRMEECAKKLGGRDDFALFMGSAVLSVKALKLGYDGLVPSSGNLVPDLWSQLFQHGVNQDWEKAEALQKTLNDIAQIFQHNRSLGQSLAVLKALLNSIEVCGPTVLPPLRTLSVQERQSVTDELFKQYPFIKDENEAIKRHRG